MKQLLIVLLLGILSFNATVAQDNLAQSFTHPPNSARPWVYAFIVDGNLTKEGITADLEALKRAGIGGLLVFDATRHTPAGPAKFMSPLWLDLYKYLVAEAKRLGLDVSLNNDAGWAGSGGPWNTPENSCQRVVWTTIQVTGPAKIDEVITQPETKLDYYRDIAMLAFPTPKGDEEDKGYRIEHFGSTKSYGGKEDWRGRVGFPRRVMTNPNWPVVSPDSCVSRNQIMDLTGQLDANGHLRWDVPTGNWTIMRIGHTPTGIRNHPATFGGEGLECDKLSQIAIDAHFAGFLEKVIKVVGPEVGKTWGAIHIDSWEAGTQNWTPLLRQEFRKRCNYDLLQFLPVLSGRVVDNLEVSERFLWDFREVIAQLMQKNYAGRLRELAHQHGMKLSIEALNGQCDEYRYAGQSDIPMAEFWMKWPAFGPEWVPRMASAAHTYGKPIVAAEAFTCTTNEKWTEHPATLKTAADWAFSEGINRMVYHRYVMQPWTNRSPGVALGSIGTHFERTQTWWEQSRAWQDYLSRCQFLLQQGVFVADICFLAPEGAPVQIDYPLPVSQRGGEWPDRPGYNFDGCSAEVLFQRMTVRKGLLTLPEGGQYRLLVLPSYNADDQPVSIYGGYDKGNFHSKIFERSIPKFETMTPATLRRIKELVEAGATVLGTRPLKSPSMIDYPGCDTVIEQLADELWGKGLGASGSGEHIVGKGKVIWGSTPEKVLAGMNIAPDFATDTVLNGKIRFTHRSLTDGTEVYFIANKQDVSVSGECTFRVQGLQPELWWPETGRIEPMTNFSENNGCTQMQLRLEQSESVFVVFRHKVQGSSKATGLQNWDEFKPLQEISGAWEVSFDPKWGPFDTAKGRRPGDFTFDKLEDWSKRTEVGIRYYSGTAIYRKIFSLANPLTAPHRLFIDLGKVAVMAEVKLNGKNLGILWKAPFRVNVTNAIKTGVNSLEIKVVNLWVNRMIGDEQLPEDSERNPDGSLKSWPVWVNEGKPSPTGRFTFTSCRLWKKDDQLVESGLLGPVTIQVAERLKVKKSVQ